MIFIKNVTNYCIYRKKVVILRRFWMEVIFNAPTKSKKHH